MSSSLSVHAARDCFAWRRTSSYRFVPSVSIAGFCTCRGATGPPRAADADGTAGSSARSQPPVPEPVPEGRGTCGGKGRYPLRGKATEKDPAACERTTCAWRRWSKPFATSRAIWQFDRSSPRTRSGPERISSRVSRRQRAGAAPASFRTSCSIRMGVWPWPVLVAWSMAASSSRSSAIRASEIR
jgi:hypothetical protein